MGLPALRGKWSFLLSQWHRLLLLGATGVSAYSVAIYTALHYTTALNASILLSVIPLVIVLLSWVFYGQAITGMQGLGVALSFSGALVIIAKGDLAALLSLQFNSGDLWMMLAIPLWAVYTIQLQRFPKELAPVGLLTATVVVGVLLLLPFYLIELWKGEKIPHGAVHIAAILYISVGATVGSFSFWTKGVTHIGAGKAGLFLHLIPVFAALLAILLLGEHFRWYHGVGMLLVFAGILVTNARLRVLRPNE